MERWGDQIQSTLLGSNIKMLRGLALLKKLLGELAGIFKLKVSQKRNLTVCFSYICESVLILV